MIPFIIAILQWEFVTTTMVIFFSVEFFEECVMRNLLIIFSKIYAMKLKFRIEVKQWLNFVLRFFYTNRIKIKVKFHKNSILFKNYTNKICKFLPYVFFRSYENSFFSNAHGTWVFNV